MTTRRLTLASSSRVHGTPFLEHLQEPVRRLFAGAARVLFVPWALKDHDGYAARVRERFADFGLGLDSIHEAADPRAALAAAEGIFIGGGNTFRLLDRLIGAGLIEPLRRRVRGGLPYLGASAGSNVAGPTISTTNDMPIVQPPTFEALALVSFQINPHYLDPDPDSTHMGESRDTRLNEFHEEHATPIVALREGAWLEVEGERVTLDGRPGGRLFLRGAAPRELQAGERVDRLLADATSG